MDLRETLESILDNNGLQFDVYRIDFNRYEFRWIGGEADMAVYADADNLADLAEIIYDEYDSFDVDYETSLWIGDDGHGKNGAPHHIRDILDDFQKYEDDLWKLYVAISNAARRLRDVK